MTEQPIHGSLVEILLPFDIQQQGIEGVSLALLRGTGRIVLEHGEVHLQQYPQGLPFPQQRLSDELLQRLRPVPDTTPQAYSLEMEAYYCQDMGARTGTFVPLVLDSACSREFVSDDGLLLPDSRPLGQQEGFSLLKYRERWAADMKSRYPKFVPLA